MKVAPLKYSYLLGLYFLVPLLHCCQIDSVDNKDGGINMEIGKIIPLKEKTVEKKHFGKINGKEVFLYTLDNGRIKLSVTNYGGIITSLTMADKNGKTGDIVLGYDSLSDYVANSPYFGAMVGRYANRIAKGEFSISGKKYKLAVNNGKNSLHGGIRGFDKVVWDAVEFRDSTGQGIILNYLSKDGEEGYPGNLKVKVIYKLDIHDNLTNEIEAESDQPTPVNICNHSYFNLSEADTNILGHHLTLYADRYTRVNEELIPTGELPEVWNTPMDFNNSQQIGSRIEKVKGGYDHNYVLKKKPGELSMAAQLFDPGTGRQIEIMTTQPGIQFYSGNFLDGTIKGKNDKIYQKHFGLCLETQHFPDSPNQSSFPNTILHPGERYLQKTIYHFSVLK